jgi:DNA processing protein
MPLERPLARLLSAGDPAYPARFHDLGARAPDPLHALGDQPWPEVPLATVVGARRATRYGRRVTTRLVAALVASGVGVVSGLARGIDGAAHRAALARAGFTVAVLGVGIDQVYPPEHGSLYTAIAARGRVLSPWPPGWDVRPHQFPARNRLLAALGDVTILVQADARSGSRHTVSAALGLGRTVWVVPWPLGHPAYEGNAQWVRAGHVRVLSAFEDAAQCARAAFEVRPRQRETPQAPDDEARLLAALTRRPRALEDLARECGVRIGAAAAAMTALELSGRVERLGSDRYRRRHR